MSLLQRFRRWRNRRTIAACGFDVEACEQEFSARSFQQLAEWMRGSATLGVTILGILYGLIVGAMPIFVVAVSGRVPPDSKGRELLAMATIVLLIVFGFLGMFAAWALNERMMRSADFFYSYGRECHRLIALETSKPGELHTRRFLASAVGRWQREAAAKSVLVEPYQAKLKKIIDKKLPSAKDLKHVAAIGRQAAVGLLRGETDLRAAIPALLREPENPPGQSWLSRIRTGAWGLVPPMLTAAVSALLGRLLS